MRSLHSLIFAAFLVFLVPAVPISLQESAKLHGFPARNCNDTHCSFWPSRGNEDFIPKQATVHISRATSMKKKTNGTDSQHKLTKDVEDDNSSEDDTDRWSYPEAFLEGDSDSGGESDVGNTAVSVANGLMGSAGTGSAALNGNLQGSTSVACSLFMCASAAQSDGKVSTAVSGTEINHSGPLINVTGPLIVVLARLTTATIRR